MTTVSEVQIFNLALTKIGKGDGAKRFATVGKSRLVGFREGDQFEWSYAEFAARYGKDIIEKDVSKIVLASPDQVAKLEKLLEFVKLPEGTVEKWLTKADAETFAEMDAETVAKCISFLKGKLVA